jgi:hypothetical protein
METAEPKEEVEYITRQECILCACEAYNTVAESNPMTKDSQKTVNEIKEKCIKIIAFYVDEMYEELFED